MSLSSFAVLLCHSIQIQQDRNQKVTINYNGYPLIMGVRTRSLEEKEDQNTGVSNTLGVLFAFNHSSVYCLLGQGQLSA